MRIIYALSMILFCSISAYMTFYFDEGAMPVTIQDVNTASGIVNSLTVLNFDFYNDVYMLTPFHLCTYFAGCGMAVCYRRFLIESQLAKSVVRTTEESQRMEISRSYRFFILLQENATVRYVMYVCGTLLMLGCMAWCYPFMSAPESQPNVHATLFSFVAPMLFVLGMSAYIFPALVGKAALFNSVTSCGMFLIVSNLSATMCLVGPSICLWYYMSSGHTIDLSWYQAQYYFDSNVVFTFLLSIVVAAVSDKPFYSLVNLGKDTKMAEEDERHSIAMYRGSTIAESTRLGGSILDNQSLRFQEVPSLRGTSISRESQVRGGLRSDVQALSISKREE